MLKMSSQLDSILNAYTTLAKIPAVVGGKLNNAGKKVTATWSVRNVDKGKNTKYVSTYTLDNNLNVIDGSDYGTDISNELLSAVSPRETFKALIREHKDGKDVKKQYLEVWNKSTLAHSVDLTALDIHGEVYADAEFGSLDWSHDETSLVYVAEKKIPKPEPFIKRKAEDKPKTDGSGETAGKKGEEFMYRQDWGEQLVGKILSVIVICKLPSETFSVLEGLPESWCPGQVRFSPEGDSVVGVAWDTEPRRLGLIFCTNRPSWVFSITIDGNMKKLSKDGLAVRSPRFSPIGDLVWLQRKAGGPHHACHQLVIMKKSSTEVRTVIDIVQTSINIEGQSFYGLYNQALPKNCFSSDGNRILLSTPQKNEVRSYVVYLDGSRLVDISNKSAPGSSSILDVRSDIILASYSNMTTPGQLFVAKLPPAGSEEDIKWIPVSSPYEPPASVATATVEYLDYEHPDSHDPIKTFNAIYFAPKADGKKLPLIVWPHGGPHTSYVNTHLFEASLFNMLGFASLRINFRGSTGQGEYHVRSLISHVGDYDIKDCWLALTTQLERDKRLGDVFLYGGSYGGLVVAHLAGLHPDRFKAMVMRNPLIDLAIKGHYADNSDGCAVETGYAFKENGPVSEDELLAMRKCSPITHVHKVKAPTAIMLGGKDKRVPYYQGLEYSRRLKANGVTARIFMYDDNHSLSSSVAEMDNLVNGALWFMEHLQ